MVTGLHPWCPLPPHPNPPPRRGEGRVGVMFLMSFLQCLGLVSGDSQIMGTEFFPTYINSVRDESSSQICLPMW